MNKRIKRLLGVQKRKTTMWARGGKQVNFNDLGEWKEYDEFYKLLVKLAKLENNKA